MSSSKPAEVLEPEVVAPEAANGKKPRKEAIAKREPTAIASTRTPGIEELMSQAVASQNMDTIERVFALRQQLKAEAAREAFFDALSAFQSECPVIKKTRKVPFKGGQGVMYRYAPLDTIIKAVSPLLTKHGLSYSIKAGVELMDGNHPFMVATLYIRHQQGHEDTSEFRVPLDAEAINASHMNDAQRYGSASTYAKRNVFLNGLGIMTGDEDDDGKGTSYTPQEARAERGPVSQPQQKPSAQKKDKAAPTGERAKLQPAPEGESVEASTIKLLTSKMEHAALSNSDFKARFGLEGLEQVNRKDLNSVLGWIIDPQNS